MVEEAQRQQVDWAAVRRAYETNDGTIKQICTRFRITKGAFENRYRRERWLSRQAMARDPKGKTLAQLFGLLDRQVCKLANEAGATLGDKEAQQLSELIKNYDKLAVIERAAGKVEHSENKDMLDLRDKLAKRIDQFKRR